MFVTGQWAIHPPKCPPLGGDLMWSHRRAQKNSIFSTYLKHVTYIKLHETIKFQYYITPGSSPTLIKTLINWKMPHFSLHLCTKLMFNITYLKKTKSRHRAWPMPHFHTQITWAWHIPKYEDNHTETFLPNIKCQTPHMLKCLYSPKQNVKYYLTSLHINEWTLAFTLTWPKTSSVHFLFLLLTLEWFFHYGTPFSQT